MFDHVLIFYLMKIFLYFFFFFFWPDDFVGNRDLSVSERTNKTLEGTQRTEDEKVELQELC